MRDWTPILGGRLKDLGGLPLFGATHRCMTSAAWLPTARCAREHGGMHAREQAAELVAPVALVILPTSHAQHSLMGLDWLPPRE